MKLKSIAILALLPLMTACAGKCDRVIKFEGYQIGKERIDAPAYIREEKMPITWKLLMDNKPAFAEMSKISTALDDSQYKTCMKMKTAPEAQKKALQEEFKRYNAGIDELAEVMQTPVKEFPPKLEAWNKDLKYILTVGSVEDKLKKQDAEDEILMEKPKPAATEKTPAAPEPAKSPEPAGKAPAGQEPAVPVSPAPANSTAPATEPAPATTAPATETAPATGTAPAPATETAPANGTAPTPTPTPAPATEPAPATAPAPGY